jgi:hypothetical protein
MNIYWSLVFSIATQIIQDWRGTRFDTNSGLRDALYPTKYSNYITLSRAQYFDEFWFIFFKRITNWNLMIVVDMKIKCIVNEDEREPQ